MIIHITVDYSPALGSSDKLIVYEIQATATSNFYTHIYDLDKLNSARSIMCDYISSRYRGQLCVDLPLYISENKLEQRGLLESLNVNPQHVSFNTSSMNHRQLTWDLYSRSNTGIVCKAKGSEGSGNVFFPPGLTREAFLISYDEMEIDFPRLAEICEMNMDINTGKLIKRRSMISIDTETDTVGIVDIHEKKLSQRQYNCHEMSYWNSNAVFYLPEIRENTDPSLCAFARGLKGKLTQYDIVCEADIEFERFVITRYNDKLLQETGLGSYNRKDNKRMPKHQRPKLNEDFYHVANPGILSARNLHEHIKFLEGWRLGILQRQTNSQALLFHGLVDKSTPNEKPNDTQVGEKLTMGLIT